MAIEVGWVGVGNPKVQIQSNHQCSLTWMEIKEIRKEGKCEEGLRWPVGKGGPKAKDARRRRWPGGKGGPKAKVPVGEECPEARGARRRKDKKTR